MDKLPVHRAADGELAIGYPPLPRFAEPIAPETILARGARVLMFLLDTSCTATLTDLDLERADSAAAYAVAAKEPNLIAVARISDVRHMIALVLADRRRIHKQPADLPHYDAGKPNVGPMAPLQPVPVSRPPAPVRQTVDVGF